MCESVYVRQSIRNRPDATFEIGWNLEEANEL